MSDSRARLSEVYRRHAPSVHRRARRILGNAAEAHEVVQDLFVTLLEKPEFSSGRTAWSAYLYAATTHACLNRLRNQRNRARLLAHREVSEFSAGLDAVELVSLRELLERLTAPLAEVAIYYFLDGMSHREIAGLIGCSRRQVGVLVERVKAYRVSEEFSCSND